MLSGALVLLAMQPAFTASSVLPANERRPRPLQPGMLVSIYGRALGPATACTGPEVMELCGTIVTVNGARASLLYVHDRQINLRMPFGGTVGERAAVIVWREDGSGSAAVPVQQESAHIAPIGRAYVGMPIWMDVRLTGHHQHSVRYPIRISPGDFGGHVFEVRRNGIELRPPERALAPSVGGGPGSPGSIGGGGFLGLPAEPKIKGRLPLHLAFRFDQPGKYEVRYTGYDWGVPGQNARILVRSRWITINVEAPTAAQRTGWLRDMRESAPADPVDLLTDHLPSLLARTDAEGLALLEPYHYHANQLVRQYSMYSLYLFDDALIAKWIPDLIRRRGPTPDLAYVLSWRKDLFASNAGQLIDSLITHLRSDTPLSVAGALQAISFLRPQYPDMKRKLDAAVLAAAPSLRRRGTEEVLLPLANYLRLTKIER